MKINKLRKEFKTAGFSTNSSRNDLIQRLEENMERTSLVGSSFVPSSISFPTFQTQNNSRAESNMSQLLHTMSLPTLTQHVQFVQRSYSRPIFNG